MIERVTLGTKCLNWSKVNNKKGFEDLGQLAGGFLCLDMGACLFLSSTRSFCNSLRFTEAKRSSPTRLKKVFALSFSCHKKVNVFPKNQVHGGLDSLI